MVGNCFILYLETFQTKQNSYFCDSLREYYMKSVNRFYEHIHIHLYFNISKVNRRKNNEIFESVSLNQQRPQGYTGKGSFCRVAREGFSKYEIIILPRSKLSKGLSIILRKKSISRINIYKALHYLVLASVSDILQCSLHPVTQALAPAWFPWSFTWVLLTSWASQAHFYLSVAAFLVPLSEIFHLRIYSRVTLTSAGI